MEDAVQMKRIIVLLVVLILCSLSPLLHAGNVSGGIDLFSRYIWRGWDLNPNKKPVLQPSLNVAFGDSGFTFSAWFSISFENKELFETNLTLSYDFQVSENIAISAGFIHYAWYATKGFTFKDNTNHEIFLSAALPKIFLTPAVSLYYDFTNGDGFYAEASVGHSFKLAKTVSADLCVSLGYNFGQWLPENVDGFSDLNVGIGIPFKVGTCTITPMATYTFVLLDEIGEEDHFWVGLSAAF